MNWHEYFFQIAETIKIKSKDPNTQVGAVLVEPETHRVIGSGYNGFPAGVREYPERWERPAKYQYVVHAEANAIAAAARFGIKTAGCDLYVTLPPCSDCAKLITAAGIKRIFHRGKIEPDGKSWRDNDDIARNIFREAGVELIAEDDLLHYHIWHEKDLFHYHIRHEKEE